MHISPNATLVQEGESSSWCATLYPKELKDLLGVSWPIMCHSISSDGFQCKGTGGYVVYDVGHYTSGSPSSSGAVNT